MVHKKVINGSVQINMSAIGWIIKNMDLEFNTIQMVINIKEDGNKINVTAKEHFGLLTQKINLEDNTLVTGKVTQNKEEELCFINLETDTMVCGWIVFHMVKEE
jgi:hypothetical protein